MRERECVCERERVRALAKVIDMISDQVSERHREDYAPIIKIKIESD